METYASTSKESASTLVGDDLAETTDHTTVVRDGVKLDTGLDAIYQKLSAPSSDGKLDRDFMGCESDSFIAELVVVRLTHRQG